LAAREAALRELKRVCTSLKSALAVDSLPGSSHTEREWRG
jgi:hypothetical protein